MTLSIVWSEIPLLHGCAHPIWTHSPVFSFLVLDPKFPLKWNPACLTLYLLLSLLSMFISVLSFSHLLFPTEIPALSLPNQEAWPWVGVCVLSLPVLCSLVQSHPLQFRLSSHCSPWMETPQYACIFPLVCLTCACVCAQFMHFIAPTFLFSAR